MVKTIIGKLIQVPDIRTIWPKETDFSDWLASPAGVELITDHIGLIIENTHREAKSDNFACDIVANLMGEEEHIVVIENQFGRSDHAHLAKLLTYTSSHKAMVGIWIAEQFADEHRGVIDWLNDNTPDHVSFYAAEIQANIISNSAPAPRLIVVSKPNTAIKQAMQRISDADHARNTWRVHLWQEIHDHIKTTKPPYNLQKPGKDHWSSITVGKSGFHMAMLLIKRDHQIAVEVNIHPDGWKNDAYQELLKHRERIETELGTPLDWRSMPDNKSSKILLYADIDPEPDENRKRVCEWFSVWTTKMYLAFQPRIKDIQAPG